MALAAANDRHHVRFYEDVGVIAEQVGSYLSEALRDGGAAIAIARPAALAMIEASLAKDGHDVRTLRARGRLELIDATEMLRSLMIGRDVDGTRFHEQIGTRLLRLCATAAGKSVHVYGEMVDLLWSDNNRDAVVTLEQLWSGLLGELPFSLVCGYHMRGLDGRDGAELPVAHPDPRTSSHANGAMSQTLTELEHRARSLEVEVARRRRLEQRMLHLVDLAGKFAAAPDREAVAMLAVEHGLRAIGAVEGAIWLLSPERTHLELVASSLSNDTLEEQVARLPLDGDTALAHVVRTGEPVFLRSLADLAQQFPSSYARRKELFTANQRAFAVLPVTVDDRTLGGITFTFNIEREFTAADRAFKAILARQCGLAFARVQRQAQERALRESAERSAAAEKEARTDIELLYELIATANQVDEVDAVYDLALRTVQRGAHSDRAAILLFDQDGVMRFKAARGLSETYQRVVEGHSPWPPEEVSPSPIAVDDVEADTTCQAFRDELRAEGIRALAFVPLVHHRRLIGKFMLYRNEPRPFTPRDLQFTETVAVHVAQAVARRQNEIELARAYREERDAHLLAEEATRAREEILSVVSHDLRNPLGTILMGAASLLNVDAGDRGHRTRAIAERIHRQANRMARLIEDLVDFAGIQAGQLAIDRRVHEPEAILSATAEIFAPMARERGLAFEVHAPPGLPKLDCDSERVVQVLSNLVANALKVTPRGGSITIGAESGANEVVLYVKDTGPGIAPDELPRLFERYWRSKHSQYKGAGLGLSIARGIVDAHGGRIWAESQPGAGTTFYFSLASLRNN